MDKSPDAFRTISEVAEDLDLPQHVLRFWETRFSQIKPMKRGGGRRYYRPDDVELLRGIRHLLYGEGYTIRGVQRILKDHGVKFVQSVWKAGAPQPQRNAADLEGANAPEAAPAAAARKEPVFDPAPAAAGESADDEDAEEIEEESEPDDGDEDEDEESAQPAEPPPPIRVPRRAEPAPARPPARPHRTAPPPVALVPPAPTPPVDEPATRSNGLTREDVRKLQAALYELAEVRRLVESALAGEK